MMPIDQVDHIDQPRRVQRFRLPSQFLRRDFHVRPAVVSRHQRHRAIDLRGVERPAQGQRLNQLNDEPGFRRDMQPRMTGKNQPQQRCAGAPGTDNEERRVVGHAKA